MPGSPYDELCNAPANVVVDIAILILLVTAELIQLLRLRKSVNAQGLSIYYVLYGALFSTAQLSMALIRGWCLSPKALKFFPQWLSSTIIFLYYIFHFEWPSLRAAAMIMTTLVYCAVVLVPLVILMIMRLASYGFSWTWVFYMAYTDLANAILAPCLLLFQFVVQAVEMAIQQGRPGALSLLAVGLQIVSCGAMAACGFLRQSERPGSLLFPFGFPFVPVYYAAQCALRAVMLACYLVMSQGKGQEGVATDETTPLLDESRAEGSTDEGHST